MDALLEFLKNYVIDLCKGFAIVFLIAVTVAYYHRRIDENSYIPDLFPIAMKIAFALVSLLNILLALGLIGPYWRGVFSDVAGLVKP